MLFSLQANDSLVELYQDFVNFLLVFDDAFDLCWSTDADVSDHLVELGELVI